MRSGSPAIRLQSVVPLFEQMSSDPFHLLSEAPAFKIATLSSEAACKLDFFGNPFFYDFVNKFIIEAITSFIVANKCFDRMPRNQIALTPPPLELV